MTTVEQAGGKIRNAIASAKSKGWTVVRNYVRGPSNSKPCACALGCMVIDIPGGVPLYSEISRRLDVEINQAIAIARGFDGARYDSDISEPGWHALGEQLYTELQEGTP